MMKYTLCCLCLVGCCKMDQAAIDESARRQSTFKLDCMRIGQELNRKAVAMHNMDKMVCYLTDAKDREHPYDLFENEVRDIMHFIYMKDHQKEKGPE